MGNELRTAKTRASRNEFIEAQGRNIVLIKLNRTAGPGLLAVVTGVWVLSIYSPLVYSFLFPSQSIQHIIEVLEGRKFGEGGYSSLQTFIGAAGHLQHPIRVLAFYGESLEYESSKWTTIKKTKFTYIAWFEKRRGPMILLVTISQGDDPTSFDFRIAEGDGLAATRILLVPLVAFAFSILWLWKTWPPRHAPNSVESAPTTV